MSNFIEQCALGERMIDEIEDFIAAWHDEDTRLELHEYLGMTSTEYSLWVEEPDVLPFIVDAHRRNKTLSFVLKEFEALPLAARSDSVEKTVELLAWLKKKGHLRD